MSGAPLALAFAGRPPAGRPASRCPTARTRLRSSAATWPCSQQLFTTAVHNSCSQQLFHSTVHNSCSQHHPTWRMPTPTMAAAAAAAPAGILQPFRSLGLVSTHVPFALQASVSAARLARGERRREREKASGFSHTGCHRQTRGSDHFATVAIGDAFHVYNVSLARRIVVVRGKGKQRESGKAAGQRCAVREPRADSPGLLRLAVQAAQPRLRGCVFVPLPRTWWLAPHRRMGLTEPCAVARPSWARDFLRALQRAPHVCGLWPCCCCLEARSPGGRPAAAPVACRLP